MFERTRTLKSGAVIKDWVCVRSLGYASDGKRVRRTFCGATKAEVLFKLEQVKAQNGGSVAPLSTLTVAQYLEDWLVGIARSRSPVTVTSYRQRIEKYALPNIGKIRLADLDARRISWLYGTLELRGVSADNVEKLHKALRSAFNDALGRGLVFKANRNPVNFVERRRHKVTKRPYLDAAQVADFFEAIKGNRLEAMFRMQVVTMMRPGEMFALHRDDLKLDRLLVDVRHNLANDKGRLSIVEAKAHSMRRIPLDPETVTALREHLRRMDAEGHRSSYVFPSERGKWMRERVANETLQAVLARAGLPKLTMYSLRHTGASLAAEAGLHIRTTADILGHSDTKITTEIYTHAGEAMHRDGVAKIARLVRDAGLGPYR